MVNININVQTWLNEKYPVDKVCQRKSDPENKDKTRAGITKLDIRKGKVGNGIFSKNKNLVEFLKLEGFTNLRKLIISSHQLIELDVSDCTNLEELDCRSNQLNILNVSGCSNLRKIDCSNNNLKNLDLSTCTKLEEVNIDNCLKLMSDITSTIISNLNYDVENGKLVRGLTKGSSRITSAQENDIRNILIVGITGNGKSALANVLADTTNSNKFEEKGSSASITKNFQKSEIFEYQGKKYCIVDNIGFGDTNNISDSDILFEIGKGIHSAKEGINQVLFVFKGRFAPEQIMAFNLFKEFIAETGITKFTTLVRTNFPSFRDQGSCEEDRQTLLNENTQLKEIIESCNGIIYVDNPTIPIIEEDSDDSKSEKEKNLKKIQRNEKKRKESRERVLNHLVDNCREIYKLKEWDSIVSKVNSYNKKKEEIERSNISFREKEKDLKKAKTELAKEVDKTIKGSIGVSVPGLPIGLNAAIEYITHIKN